MRLHFVSALLILLFALTVSVPNLFAESSVESAVYLTESQRPMFLENQHYDIKNESLLYSLKHRFYHRSAGFTKYGVDLLSITEGLSDVKSLSLRTGFNRLSRRASAGVQLVVSW